MSFTPRDDGALDVDDTAAPDTPPCTFGAFGAPSKLPGPINSSVDDWTPSISADDLSIVFYSQRASPGSPDIWIASRATPTSDFGAASEITEVSSTARDEDPHITGDGRELFLVTDRVGGPNYDIYSATRATALDAFSTPTVVPGLGGSFDEDTLWLSQDGLRIVFSSNRGTSYDLYVAERPDRNMRFGAPSLISELATASVERSPALSADELEIFFISNRAGGTGAYDVWYANRRARADPFGTPVPVPVLNSIDDEWGLSLSADGRALYYSFDSPRAGGNADIWVATRDCM